MKRKFLSHNDRILINDAISEKKGDWTNIVSKLSDSSIVPGEISSFNDFYNSLNGFFDALTYLLRISSFIDISKYLIGSSLKPLEKYIKVLNGRMTLKDAIKESVTAFEEMLSIVSFLTKLKNDFNGTKNVFFFDYFLYFNSFKYTELKVLRKEYLLIKEVFKKLNASFKKTWVVFASNCKRIPHKCSKRFLKEIKHENRVKPFFSAGNDYKLSPTTYEEAEITSMTKISIGDNGELIPLVTYRSGEAFPNTNHWSSENLDYLDSFFEKNSEVLFIIETVDYLKNQNPPSDGTCFRYINLIKKWCFGHRWHEGHDVFSLYCKLSKDKKVNKTVRTEFEKIIFPKLRSRKAEYYLIKKMYDSGIYLPDNFIKRIRNHGNVLFLEYFKKIKLEYALREIVTNEEIVESITRHRFFRVRKAFYSIIPTIDNGAVVGDLYLCFGRFLCNPALTKLCIDLETEKIRLINHWQRIGFECSKKGLQTITGEPQQVPTSEIKKYSETILKDPRNFGFSGFSHSEKDFWRLISRGSSNPFPKIINTIRLNKTFPKKEMVDSSHDFTRIIANQIEIIKKGKEYKLLNSFKSEEYVIDYYDEVNLTYNVNLALFQYCKELYESIKSKHPELSLIEWQDEASYSFICQLFPALEDQIIKNGIKNGISPLKEKDGIFDRRKEPSTILIRRFKKAMVNYNSLESVSDLLAVYLMMYDGMSMNIRNTVVHGNEYPLDARSLERYRKAVVISLGIIITRNETE